MHGLQVQVGEVPYYCSRDYKMPCKKRSAELFDEELFKDAPEREECPICMLPLPFDDDQRAFNECCGKLLCQGTMQQNAWSRFWGTYLEVRERRGLQSM